MLALAFADLYQDWDGVTFLPDASKGQRAVVHTQLIRQPCSQVHQNAAYGNTLAHT